VVRDIYSWNQTKHTHIFCGEMSEQVITAVTVGCEDLLAAGGNKTFPFQEAIEAPVGVVHPRQQLARHKFSASVRCFSFCQP
jgi:hypothetical protein